MRYAVRAFAISPPNSSTCRTDASEVPASMPSPLIAAGPGMSSAPTAAALLTWPASRWLARIADLASPHLSCRSLSPTASCWSQRIWPSPRWSGGAPTPACLSLAIRRVSSRPANQARMACRPLFRYSRGRRAIRLPDREWSIRSTRQRSAPQKILTVWTKSMRTSQIDAVLITGDLTDAGRSAEWSELLVRCRRIPGCSNASCSCRAITISTSSIAPTPPDSISDQPPPTPSAAAVSLGGRPGPGRSRPGGRSRRQAHWRQPRSGA